MSEANPRRGLVAIAAGGAALVIAAVVGLVIALRSCGSEARPRPVGEASGNASVAEQGEHAPGTTELRALGCDPAIVVDMARLLGGASHVKADEPRTMVTCDVSASANAPTCERVATVYLRAIGGTADHPVGVRILPAGAAAPACSRLFAPNGADLGVFPKAP